MNKLIIVRHGEYGNNYHLNNHGVKQMISLSEKLKDHINGEPVIILSSSADRAKESAEILSERLDVEMESYELLWSDLHHNEDYEGTYTLIKEKGKDVGIVIIVTHLEYTQELPRFFSEQEFGSGGDPTLYGYNPMSKGEACIVDCKSKTKIRV